MKSFLTFAAIGVMLALMTKFAVAADAQVLDGGARLRSGPATSHAVLAHLPGGLTVKLHGCPGNRSWCRIGVSGRRGWVAKSRLSFYHTGRTGETADHDMIDGGGKAYVKILARVTDRPGYCYALSLSGSSIIVNCP